MIINRDQVNFLRWNVQADTLVLSGCSEATLSLTVDSICDKHYLYSVTIDCDLVVGFYDYELKLGGASVKTGKISVR